LIVDIKRNREFGLSGGVPAAHGFLLRARFGPI
jgi:hypothetical protein